MDGLAVAAELILVLGHFCRNEGKWRINKNILRGRRAIEHISRRPYLAMALLAFAFPKTRKKKKSARNQYSRVSFGPGWLAGGGFDDTLRIKCSLKR